MSRIPGLMLILWAGLAVAASGCDHDASCTDAAPIVPGCGVSVGEHELVLGQPFAEVEEALGASTRERDLGTLGTSFAYPEAGLTGFHLDGVVTILTVESGFDGATAGGVGVGSAAVDVESELGAGSTDAVLGARWYRDLGIGFELTDGQVTRIQLFEPGT